MEKSRAYWYHIVSLAHAYLDHRLAPQFTNPQHALHRIPKFPGRLKSPFERPLGTTSTFALCSLASSTWRVVGDSRCDAVEKESTRPALVQIGTRSAIPFRLCGNVFSHWIGTTAEKATGPKYLGILAIGWCYILSARLVELQGESAIMRYTSSLLRRKSLQFTRRDSYHRCSGRRYKSCPLVVCDTRKKRGMGSYCERGP